MYRRIVAGTDGSSTAQEAVRHASALAAATGACLTVVNAYAAPEPGAAATAAASPAPSPAPSPAALPDRRRHADAVLEHCAMRLPAVDVPLRLQARAGEAGDVLLRVVDELAADLLVLGSDRQPHRQPDGTAGLPERVAASAPCAVLLVRSPQP